MAQTNGGKSVYQFYYNPFSICSLFVLYTLELKGKPKSASDVVEPERCFVDIYLNEQMSEEFLKKNPKGQVPSLLAPSLSVRIPDSSVITKYLAERYPSLLPEEHKDTINPLLDELHKIAFVVLSFKPEEKRVEAIIDDVKALIAREDISEGYRAALQKKLDFHLGDNLPWLPVSVVEKHSSDYLEKISGLLSKQEGSSSSSPSWIFGPDTGPTALDAHTVVFLARLRDAKKEHLIPENVLAYGKWALAGKEWLAVNEGRPTLHSVYEKQMEDEGKSH